jgi:hypothetical protein
LRKHPFYEDQRTLRVPGGPVVTIKHHQIIVWVSITQAGLAEFPPRAPRFPAVLDTGFNDTFLLQEQQFTAWAGLSAHDFDVLDSLMAYDCQVPMLDADV